MIFFLFAKLMILTQEEGNQLIAELMLGVLQTEVMSYVRNNLFSMENIYPNVIRWFSPYILKWISSLVFIHQ